MSAKLTAQIAKLEASITKAQAVIDEANKQLPDLITQLHREVEAAERAAQIEAKGVPIGSTITFDYGRAATRTERSGKVLAFRPKTDTVPAAYKVEVGEGFDIEAVTVLAVNVKSVTSAEQPLDVLTA